MAKQQPKPATKETPKAKAKQKTQQAQAGWPFLKFLVVREQWIDWALIGGLFVAILIFLKIYYPYPQTETDTGMYVTSALTGQVNAYRPFGYSNFLNFFHSISTDVRFVVSWQWFMSFLSVTFFLFTIKFTFRNLQKAAFYILCLITILNPSVIFMDSYIMSDSLFVSLTLLLLTTVIWMINTGSYIAIVANLFLLWWCMDVRYIGLFYPLFSACGLGWALWRRYRWVAIAGVVLPFGMLLLYRSSVSDRMKEAFGTDMFSAFGGWQKANNGTVVLPYVKIDESKIPDPEIRAIQHEIRQFPDSVFSTEYTIATSFMWVPSFPGKTYLRKYLMEKRRLDPTYDYTRAWVEVAAQYERYGDYLQANYRSEYIKGYIIPNFKLIFKAHEIHDIMDTISYKDISAYFSSDRPTYTYHSHFFRSLTGIRQTFDTIAWVLLFISVLGGLVMIRRLGWTLEQKLSAGVLILFVAAFGAVSTIAAPINNFRYIMPIFYAQVTAPLLILSAIVSSFWQKQTKPKDL